MRHSKLIVALAFVALLTAAASAQESPNYARGFEPDKTFAFGELDSVNLFNGNLMLTLPMGQRFPVSETLDYGFTLTYNSKVWDYEREHVTVGDVRVLRARPYGHRGSNAGLGWAMTFGRFLEDGFQTPDGAIHPMPGSLTNDSTYIRAQTANDVTRVDFPSGVSHYYERFPKGDGFESRITRMFEYAAPGNFVQFEYPPTSDLCPNADLVWKIEDSHGRKHEVCLAEHTFNDEETTTLMIEEIYVSTFANGPKAKYDFHYAPQFTQVGCNESYYDNPFKGLPLTILTHVDLPDGSKYSFTYNATESSYGNIGGARCDQGTIHSMELPTGGSYEFEYWIVGIPASTQCGGWEQWAVKTTALHKKIHRDENGNELGTWEYLHTESASPGDVYTCMEGQDPETNAPPGVPPFEELKTTVILPSKDRLVHYFAVWPGMDDFLNDSPNGYDPDEHGTPFTKLVPPVDGRYLSSEVFDCDPVTGEDCQPIRRTYVKFDSDNGPGEGYKTNRRVKAERTFFVDDGNNWRDVEHDEFDGFGHYRYSTITGSIAGTPIPVRESFTNYNPGSSSTGRKENGDPYIGPNEAWAKLNNYTEITTQEGSEATRAMFCFDEWGFLRGRRLLKDTNNIYGPHDVITLFRPSVPEHNTEQEDWFGGDTEDVSGLTDLCAEREGSQYRITHTWDKGVRTSSSYRDAGGNVFLTAAVKAIDPWTGLVTSSTDSAGVVTSFTYDSSARLKTITSTNAATVRYDYYNKGEAGVPNAAVKITVDSAESENDSQQWIHFDSFGRVFFESRELPDGLTSNRRTEYDGLGRRKKVSMWEATPSHFTVFDYDALGRMTHVTAPDGKTTTNTFTGERILTRTALIGNVFNLSTGVVLESHVGVTEVRDLYGRLLEIQEGRPATVTNGVLSSLGNPEVTTKYGYDLAGRLRTVAMSGNDMTGVPRTQSRSFEYDRLGFLRKENHPESGQTEYRQYDAKGHARYADFGATRDIFDLEFIYDRAERQTEVRSRTAAGAETYRLQKKFVFDSANDHGKSKGKLAQSIRHNYTDFGDVVVTETFHYGDTAGRLTNKKTKIENVTTGTTYQELDQGVEYNDLGLQKTIIYPTCIPANACGAGNWASLTQSYEKGYLKSVSNFIEDITYHANGLYDTITHAGSVAVKDIQENDPHGMPRPRSIRTDGGVACPLPAFSEQPAGKTIPRNTPTRLTVAATNVTTYQWYRGAAGDRTNPVGTSAPFYDTDPLAEATSYWVELRSACGTARSNTIVVDVITCGSSTFSITASPANIAEDQPFVLTAPAIVNTTYKWYRGNHTSSTLLATTTTETYNAAGITAATAYFVEMSDPVCNVTPVKSQVLTVTPCIRPADRTIDVTKATVGFDLSVENEAGVTFQWYQGTNTSDLSRPVGSGATINVNPAVPTSYWVRMSRTCGNVTAYRDSAFVLVDRACEPSIFVQPIPATKAFPPAPDRPLQTASASVSATVVPGGTGPFEYQWFDEDDQAIQGETGPTFTWTRTIEYPEQWPNGVQQTVYVKVRSCNTWIASDRVQLSLAKTPQKFFFYTTGDTVYRSSHSAQLGVRMDPEGAGHAYEYEWYQADGTSTGRKIEGLSTRDVQVGPHDGPGIYWVKVTGYHSILDPQGNLSEYREVSMSPHMYVQVYGECELPPLQVSQSLASIGAGSAYTGPVVFLAKVDWENVEYQWYRGQSGDTREPVSSDTGMPNQLSVSSGSMDPYWVRASLECGAHRDSETLFFTRGTCAPVFIDQNIPSVNVAWDASTSLTVSSIDVDRPSYTWYSGEGQGTVVGTSQTLSLPNVRASGRYWVKVRNLDCSTGTDSFLTTVRVASAPSITPPVWQPEIWTNKGTSTTLNATSTGATGYEWYRGDVGDTSDPIGGASLATYVTPVLTADAKYWVRVKGANGHLVDSPTVTVKVCEAPAIHPPHLTTNLVPGQNTYIGISPSAGTKLSYQWYEGVSGVTTKPVGRPVDKLLVGPAVTTNYWVRVTANCGVGGNAPQSIDSPTFTVSICPTITVQPAAQHAVVMPNGTTQLSLTATGSSLTYQWYRGQSGNKSNPIAGATSSTYTTAQLTAATTYWCEVKSGSCERYSDEVTVAICDYPTVQWQQGNRNARKGETLFFSATTTPNDPGEDWPMVTYYMGETGNVAGSTLVHGPAQYGFNRAIDVTSKFWARATLGNCYADTPNITVTVCIPQITAQPAGGNINTGSSHPLSVVTDIPAAGYQWYRGEAGDTSQPVSGATAATLSVSPTVDTRYWVRVKGCGTFEVDSTSALVTVCTPPAITSQPVSVWIEKGATRQLQAGTSGTNLTYKWYRGNTGDTTNQIGNNTDVFVSPVNTTNYWVRVSNGCGAADSNTATVSVCADPVITQQPLSQKIFSGKTATLSVTATQDTTTPMTYQWYTGATSGSGTPISGATSPTYTTPALTAAASYWVRITAGNGICQTDSAVATISMCSYSEILNAPADRDISIGQSVRLDLTLSPVPQSGKWYRGAQGDRTNLISNYTFVDVAPTVTTQYWGEFTHDGCAAKTRTVTVYVSIPTITSHPASVQVNANQTTTLTVAANTTGLTYQWYQGPSGGGTPIGGATGASYTTPAMTATTSYWVKVTGSRGHVVNSNTATVTVCAPAAITAQPTNRSIQKGASTTLSVTATGTNLQYQWYQGASGTTTTPVGTNSNQLTVSPTTPRSYWVRVTSDCGAVNSTAAQVDVCATPVITQQPLSQKIFSGRSTTLSVVATQETGLAMTYQWYSGTTGGGTPISGATSSSYTTPVLTADASYWVKITSGVCQVNSNTATVSMCAYNETINAPADRDISVGQTVRLDVTLSPVPQSGRWYRGAQGDRTNPISGYTFVDVSPTVTTQYWGEYTHDGCAAKTRTVTVFVSIPTITQQPAPSTLVNGGQTATLTVAANTAGVTYQWFSGTTGTGTAISGATSATYVVPAMASGSTANFWVRVTGSRGHVANSDTANVLWCTPASISQQPQSRSIRRGYSASLSVTASGTNIRYQWYNGASGNESSAISSATSSSITVNPTVPKQYWVKAISDCGSVNSVTANVDVCIDPTINTQPASQVVNSGSSATLTVSATAGTALPLSYQWYTSTGTLISGATSATYVTPALTNPASYFVRVTSGVCDIDSAVANVTICAYPATVNAPSDRNIAAGQQTQLRVVLSPVAQSGIWYRGVQGDRTNPISGQISPYVSPSVTTQYWGELTHDGCKTMTRTVTVNVCKPAITSQPDSTTINYGQSTTLSVTATTATSYQWYAGPGTPIPGATSATYTTGPLYQTTDYWVRVTGPCDTVDSNYATVTVQ